jgi:hypothetical protein
MLSSLNNSQNHLLVHNHQNDSRRVLFTTCGTPFSLGMLSGVCAKRRKHSAGGRVSIYYTQNEHNANENTPPKHS